MRYWRSENFLIHNLLMILLEILITIMGGAGIKYAYVGGFANNDVRVQRELQSNLWLDSFWAFYWW